MKVCLTFLSIIIFCSCGPELPDGDKLINEIYYARVKEYEAQKAKDCKQKAIAAAEEHVDSIVHRMLNADLVDSLDFPTKPLKPSRPKSIIGKVDKFEIRSN